MADFLLALDQGTSSSRALLFDRTARLVAVRQVTLPVDFPQPGWVEQDPAAIWRTQRDATRAVLRAACTAEDRVLGIGIANQRETTVVWDRATRAPIGPAIVWQCRRTADQCRALAASHGELIRARTGLVADAYFSGPKIGWLLTHTAAGVDRAAAGELAAGTVDTWLLAQATGGRVHATDRTNASRTLLFDIHRGAWDADLAQAVGAPPALLPTVQPSLGEFAVTDTEAFGVEAPVLAMAGDQQASLFGQGCHGPGPVKVTYGTGAFVLTHTGDAAVGPVPGLLTTAAVARGDAAWEAPAYALEGSVFSAGSMVQWLRDALGLVRDSADIEELAGSVADSGGVSVVPAFTGLGAPHWEPEARTLVAGVSRGTGPGELARAALEGIAFRVREVVEALERATGHRIPEVRVDGGAARNDLLMQIQANALQRPVVRPAETETTALGAALMAGVVAGVWPSVTAATDAAAVAAGAETKFPPEADLERAYTRWEAAREAAVRLGRSS